jgi:hypothetical protein
MADPPESATAIEVFTVSLRIFGAAEFHAEIDRTLGARCGTAAAQGERVPLPPLPHGQARETDGWILSAPPSLSVAASSQFEWILTRIAEHGDFLRGLARRGARMDISCTCVTQHRSTTLDIEPSVMRTLSGLNLPIRVSITCIAGLWHQRKGSVG